MKVQKFKRGQVWWYNMNAVWDGSTYNQGKNRPVIIISNDLAAANSSSLICVPCTTQEKKFLPTHINFEMNGLNNTAMAESILSVNIDKFGAYIGTLDDELMEKLEGSILVALGMKNAIRERCECKNLPTPENPISIENQMKNFTPVKDNKLELIKENGTYKVKPDELTLKMVNDMQKVIKQKEEVKEPKRYKMLSIEEKKLFLKEYSTKSKKYMLDKYELKNEDCLIQKAYNIRKQLGVSVQNDNKEIVNK